VARFAQHVETVIGTARDLRAAARSRLVASWRRSLDHHGLDPARRDDVARVSAGSLAERRERAETLIRLSAPRLDALYQLVGSSGCGVLLRPKPGDCRVFCSWGDVPCPPVRDGRGCCP